MTKQFLSIIATKILYLVIILLFPKARGRWALWHRWLQIGRGGIKKKNPHICWEFITDYVFYIFCPVWFSKWANEVDTITPIFQYRKWGSERLVNLLKITQLLRGGVENLEDLGLLSKACEAGSADPANSNRESIMHKHGPCPSCSRQNDPAAVESWSEWSMGVKRRSWRLIP